MKRPSRLPLIFAALAIGLSAFLNPSTVSAKDEKKDEEKKEEKKKEDEAPQYKLMEDGTADLGKYRIEIFDPILRKTLSVNFDLLGSVRFEDQDKFMDYMNRHYYQLRELVNTAVRTCTADQLTDPTHHTFKRKLTSRINRAFGWKFLKSVEPINYRLIQSSKEEGVVLIPLRPMPIPEDK